MSTSADGGYAVPVSGPSPRLALLRTIYLKVHGVARAAWAKTRLAMSTAVRLPRQVATTAVSVLSTGGGYDAAVHAASGALRGAWRLGRWLVRTATRGARWVGNGLARLLGRISPAAEASARGWTSRLLRPLRDAATWLARTVEGAATAAESLAGMPLVRTATTTAAKVGGGILLVHAATRGAAAAKVVSLVPGAMTFVVHLTNPWQVLGGVAAVAAGSIAVALVRLLAAGSPPEPTPDGGATARFVAGPRPDSPTSRLRAVVVEPFVPDAVAADGPDDPAPVEPVVAPVAAAGEYGSLTPEAAPLDLEEIARHVHVVVERDGAVVVTGIPATVPEGVRGHVARIATDAAVARMRRTLRARPTPSRDDRRLFTKAAREAVAAEARRLRLLTQPGDALA